MTAELHPESQSVLDRLDAENVPPLHTLSVESARQTLFDLSDTDPGPYGDERVRDLAISAAEDAADVPIRIYDPSGDGPKPIFMYVHGGGWALGGLDSVDGLCRLLAVESNCLVASVSYRLAPEHQFPTQLNDVRRAFEWLCDHGDVLGGDSNRIAVGGDSAGGNLATALAIWDAEQGGSAIDYQLLFYPVTNYAFDTDSYEENGEGYYLTRRDMEYFWECYLGNPVHGANPYASPLQYRDLSDLPPTYVMTCEFDPLRDDGRAYAERLEEADVAVTYENVPDMIHGYVRHVTRMDRAKETAIRAASLLKDGLAE